LWPADRSSGLGQGFYREIEIGERREAEAERGGGGEWRMGRGAAV